jgi:hypothetical protein
MKMMPNSPPDTEDTFPLYELRTPLPAIEGEIAVGSPQIDPKHHDTDSDRQRTRKAGAGDTQGVTGGPACDQHRGEHDVDQQGQRLDHHGWLHDAGTAQRRRHHQQDELQCQRRHEPEQVNCAGLDGGIVGRERTHVLPCQQASGDHGQDPAQRGQAERLVEGEVCVSPILASHRLRDECHGADTERLRERIDQEPDGASGGDAGYGGVTQAGHEMQIDQLAEQRHDDADENRRGHGHDMAHDGALGQVFHDWNPMKEGRSVVNASAHGFAASRQLAAISGRMRVSTALIHRPKPRGLQRRGGAMQTLHHPSTMILHAGKNHA